MVIFEIDGKSFNLKNQWSEITLSEGIQIAKLDKPNDYLALITKEKEISDEIYKELPKFYLNCIDILSNAQWELLKYFNHEQIFHFWVYIRDIVNTILYGQPHIDPIDKFTFKGETYYLPETLTKNGVKYPFGKETLLTFAESADMLIAGKELKAGHIENMPLIISILARKENESYSESNALERAEVFKDLTMDISWSVFFYLLKLWSIYAGNTVSSLAAEASPN